ncbi:MAG TPA: nitroreductase family protein [Acidimicrobiales bacterium]|nr:nitroreductase family protein [Acidimicrobiales bacterium]
MIDLYEGICTTRSIRRFTAEPVSDDDLAAILFAASRAPNGSNRQAFRFVVLRDGPVATEAKAILGRAFRSTWESMKGAGRYERLAEADTSTAAGRAGRAMQQFVDRFEQIPVVILPCLIRYRPPDPTEGASVYPACQNLLLAARHRGLGGVLTMWHGAVEDELRTVLGIPEGVAIAATVPIGHPEGRHGPVRRRPLGEVVYEDRWEGPAPWAVDPPGTRFTR